MEGPGAASGRRALSQRPFLPYRLLPPRAVSPRLIFPYSALHLPLSFLTPRRIPLFFPCSAPHFPPFFPRFTSHLSPGPLSPPRGGERFLRSFFQKATLPSPLLPIPAPVCSVSCIPPSCVLRFLYSHPPVCSVSCISTPPVCCVFRIPAPHGSGNFPLPGLDRCRPLCYTVHKKYRVATETVRDHPVCKQN